MRRWSIVLLCMWCACNAHAQNTEPKLGLGLFGEGAAAFANVGVLRALVEANIQPQIVSATGISSYIAALYATGHSPAQIDAACRRLAAQFVTANAAVRGDEYPDDFAIYREMAAQLLRFDAAGLNLDRLPVSLQLVGIDVATGERVIVNQGGILRGVRSTLSSAVTIAPGQFSDRRLRSAGGDILDVLRAKGADALIMVDAGGKPFPAINGVDSRMDDLLYTQQAILDARGAQLRMSLAPNDVSIWIARNFAQNAYEDYDEAVAAGYDAARRELAALKALQPSKPIAFDAVRNLSSPGLRVSNVFFYGNEFVPSDLADRHFALKSGDAFTAGSALRSLDSALATGLYRSVSIDPVPDGAGNVMVLFYLKEAAAAFPRESLPLLEDALSPKIIDDRKMIRAARALGKMGALARPLVPVLTRNLDVPASEVRRAMLEALADLGEFAADQLEPVRTRALRPEFTAVRSSVIRALVAISLGAANGNRVAALPSMRAARETVRNLQGGSEALMTLNLAIGRLESLQATAQAARDSSLSLENAAAFAGKTRVRLNGVDTPVRIDIAGQTVKFLSDRPDLRPGMNLIDGTRFWLEGLKLAAYDAPFRRSYAIVAAIGDYKRLRDPQQRGPTGFDAVDAMVPGAQKLVSALERVGFPRENILTLFDANATSEGLERTLRRFWEGGDLAGADRLFVYFGGHGSVFETTPLLVTYDYDPKRPTVTSFQMQDLVERQARNLRPHHVLFALDACHAGLTSKHLSGSTTEKAQLIRFQTLAAIRRDSEPRARNLLVAGTGDQLALYKNGGLFTQALVASLGDDGDLNDDGVIQFEEFVFSVRNWVTDHAGREMERQDPDYRILDAYGSGRFMFFTR